MKSRSKIFQGYYRNISNVIKDYFLEGERYVNVEKNDKYSISCHEAAHAVACEYLGVDWDYIQTSIAEVAGHSSGGHIKHILLDEDNLISAEINAKVAAAGIVVYDVIEGLDASPGAFIETFWDNKKLSEFVGRYWKTKPEQNKHKDRILKEVHEDLAQSKNKYKIIVLANALLGRDRIDRVEALALWESAHLI